MESPDHAPQVELPEEFQDLHRVFSKTQATFLPPHRPWDCAIDLLSDAALPRGHVYPLLCRDRGHGDLRTGEPPAGFYLPLYITSLLKLIFVKKRGTTPLY